MKTKNLFLLAAICMACTSFAAAQNMVLETTTPFERVDIGDPEVKPKIWAVVVGIERYAYENCLPKLRYSKNDALKIESYLQYQLGVPPDQIETLLDEKATEKNITEKIKTHFNKAGKNDMVFFYYAGHGALRKLLPHNYQCPDDGSSPYPIVEYGAIENVLSKCAASKKMVVIDACQTNDSRQSIQDMRRLQDEFYENLAKSSEGTIWINSASPGQMASEPRSDMQQGRFTFYFLQGLKGGADKDGDNKVNVQELLDYIDKVVPEKSNREQIPKHSKKGSYDPDMLIGW